MPVPAGIEREHVLRAIIYIDRHGVPAGRSGRNWFLEYEGRLYPVKYVVSVANMFANGRLLDPGEFTTDDAVRLLQLLGFNVVRLDSAEDGVDAESVNVTVSAYPPDDVDTAVRHALEVFTSILEGRLRREGEGSLNESTVRFLLLHTLVLVMPASMMDVYLEYPYGGGGGRMDLFLRLGGGRSMAVEVKAEVLAPPTSTVAKTESAGRVFADILRLARLRGDVKRYFVYVAGRDMIVYFKNRRGWLRRFLELGLDEGFRLTREMLASQPSSFVREVERAVGERSSWPEPLVACRFSGDLKVRNWEVAVRAYEVKA